MLQQNWFADSKFEMFEDYGDVQSFYDTETKNIYVVMEEYGQKGSNTIQEITPDSEEYAPNYGKYKDYMENKYKDFMSVVREMCTRIPTKCRSLNMVDLARRLMDMINVPQNGLTFIIPGYPVAFGLYAGYWKNGTESMQLEITGVICKDDHSTYIDYWKKEMKLPLDYFKTMTK